MTPRESFLDDLRERTTAHLTALARESGETFARYLELPELGTKIYGRLVDQFNMDGAQEIAAALIDLFTGGMDDGTVMLSDREYRGMRAVLKEFDPELPDEKSIALRDLITTLARADKGGT